MKTITEHCRHCSYKFKESEYSDICPVCCGSRDRYSNLAKEWGCTREEAKAKCLTLIYGEMVSTAQEIYDKHGKGVLFGSNNES